MDVTVEHPSEERVVVHVAGPLNGDDAPALRTEVEPLLGDGCRRIVLDLEHVRSCDHNALAVLVSISRRVRSAGGELRLENLRAPLEGLLSATGLDRVLAGRPANPAASS